MGFTIPAAKNTAALILGKIEGLINQVTPLLDKAFNRVLSGALSLGITGLYKFASDAAKQNFVVSATDLESLKVAGADLGVNFKDAVAAIVQADLPATNGTVIGAGSVLTGDLNGLRYFVNINATAAGGVAALELTCERTGTAGNLQNGDTLSLGAQIDGATTEATVTGTVTSGADPEDKEDYRSRILTAQRVRTGGANAADFRIWAEEVVNVKAAYPYAGRPLADIANSSPPDRTVYVEAVESYNVDGIADQPLLDLVRANITTDPATVRARQPLGLTDETLFVESITRLEAFVEVRGLSVDSAKEVDAKAAIKTALDNYFKSVVMFIDGVDFISDRNDIITVAALGGVVTDALVPFGGIVTGVAFGFDSSVARLKYQLQPGELVKMESGSPTYA